MDRIVAISFDETYGNHSSKCIMVNSLGLSLAEVIADERGPLADS